MAKKLIGGNFSKITPTSQNSQNYFINFEKFVLYLEPVDNVLQTLGFSLIELRHHDYNVNLYDLGGSAQIRGIWNKYYMDVSPNSYLPS